MKWILKLECFLRMKVGLADAGALPEPPHPFLLPRQPHSSEATFGFWTIPTIYLQSPFSSALLCFRAEAGQLVSLSGASSKEA